VDASVLYDESAILRDRIKMGNLYVYYKLDNNELLMAEHENIVPID
jgi:hypothetical protein